MIIAQIFSDHEIVVKLHDQILIRLKKESGILTVSIKTKTNLKVEIGDIL
jgi:hypothetical protein